MTEEKLALLIFEQSEHTSEVGMAKQRLAMNVCQRMAAAIWPKVKSLGTSSSSPKITVAESTALADAIELRRAEGNHGAAIHLQSLFDKLVRAASSSTRRDALDAAWWQKTFDEYQAKTEAIIADLRARLAASDPTGGDPK